MSFTAFCTYFFSLFSTCSLWLFDKKKVATFFMAFTILCGFTSSNLQLQAIALIGLYFSTLFLFYQCKTSKWAKAMLGFMIFFIAVGLAKHIFPGFLNWRIINAWYISQDAYPYSQWLNIDKIIAGFGIGVFALIPLRRALHWKHMTLSVIPSLFAVSAIIASLALLFEIVRWDPKIPDLWLVWIMINLLVTCVCEEFIFRLFLQNSLLRVFSKSKYASYFAIGISALLFGAFHIPAPPEFILLSFIAGIFYGYIYHKTDKIEASILMHFLINSAHFFLFSYPMLAM